MSTTEIKVITNAMIQAKIDLAKFGPTMTALSKEILEKKIAWCESKLRGN